MISKILLRWIFAALFLVISLAQASLIPQQGLFNNGGTNVIDTRKDFASEGPGTLACSRYNRCGSGWCQSGGGCC